MKRFIILLITISYLFGPINHGEIKTRSIIKNGYIRSIWLKSLINWELELYNCNVNKVSKIIYAMVWYESRFKTAAIGKAGEIGLMQVLPDTLDYYNRRNKTSYKLNDLNNPTIAIKTGVYYFMLCLDRYKNYRKAIKAYNTGINRKRQRNENYYKRVMIILEGNK